MDIYWGENQHTKTMTQTQIVFGGTSICLKNLKNVFNKVGFLLQFCIIFQKYC